MPRLFIRPDALRHNLSVIDALCRHAGRSFMFVLKESPLLPELLTEILPGSPVRKLGLIVWPHNALPQFSNVELHHLYAAFPHTAAAAAACRTVYLSSRWSMDLLAEAIAGNPPSLRLVLEVGDLRDGAMAEELPGLCRYAHAKGFSICGLSVNYGCITEFGPSATSLQYAAETLENIRTWCRPEADVSAGGTDILPLVMSGELPDAVREIRCGTGVMLGTYPLMEDNIPGCRQDTFRLEADVLECRMKQGRQYALLDVGKFHTDLNTVECTVPGMKLAGASSAYSVFDVTDCPERIHEGRTLHFRFTFKSLAPALLSRALTVIKED